MKKIISAVLAAVMLLGMTTVFAETNRAILLCYDDSGSLIYSSLLRSEDGDFNITVSAQYDETKKKIYYIDTQEFKDIEEVTAEETSAPTEAPAATAAPTAKPAATTAPSSSKTDMSGTPYEREVDGINAPALVVDVETAVNANDEDIYTVTIFYHGEEIKVAIDEDLTIATAPEEYSYMRGRTMDSLEKGDVICLTANIKGDEIKAVDFITRPTKEDIVTSGSDYGESFEGLFASGGKVAGKWAYLKYGQKPSSDKYHYAYGIVAKMSNGNLTLLNTAGITDDALEIDVDEKAYVYTCAVDGKEYEVEIGGRGDITTSLPNRILTDDIADLNDDYVYNYALVRLVDGTATDIILYTNYND